MAKYVIEIDSDYYEMLKHDVELGNNYLPCKIIANATPLPKGHWIPVSKRLPEIGKNVLVTNIYGDIFVWTLYKDYPKASIYTGEKGLYWENEVGDFEEFEEAIAWCELPEPYRAEDSEVEDG